MRKLVKTVAISTGCLLISYYTLAQERSSAVYAVAIDDCQVVEKITLSEREIKAWKKMNALEKQMQSIQQPLEAVEEKLSKYSKEIKELSDLAIQETEQTLYIDKELLKKTEHLADKISHLADTHRADFDAIGDLGEQIGNQADIFSETIEAAFESIEYDRVQIYQADEPLDLGHCYSDQTM